MEGGEDPAGLRFRGGPLEKRCCMPGQDREKEAQGLMLGALQSRVEKAGRGDDAAVSFRAVKR